MKLGVMRTQFMRQTPRGVKYKNIISNILFTRVWIELHTFLQLWEVQSNYNTLGGFLNNVPHFPLQINPKHLYLTNDTELLSECTLLKIFRS